jgi:molybdate transport system ATP-binding protein
METRFRMPSPKPPKVPFITLDAIRIRVGDHTLFEGDTWRIHNDEQWVVIGANASGKSTLVNALGGRARVTGGTVWYHFACTDLAESYPMDGTVPEEAIAYVSLEAQRELATAAATYHQARWNSWDNRDAPTVRAYLHAETGATARAIRAAADQVELEGLLARQLPQLSNGELRKLLLARALLAKPRLLVLDDPYAGLDVAARARLAQIIEALLASPLRVVFVVQRAEELPRGATHIAYVDNGRIAAQGPRRKMLGHPGVKALLAAQQPARRTAPCAPKAQSPPATKRTTTIPLVQLVQVRVAYGNTVILHDVNWTVRAGERWLLVGPNGAGKTTLLSLLLGDNPQAYANAITLFGKRRGSGESIWDIKKRIGWVAPELQWHYDQATPVQEVVGSGFHDSIGLYRPLTRAQKRKLAAVLQRVGLDPHAKRGLGELSTGEQRLALLARALVKQPPLLLLDEPCQGLDAAHRDQFHAVLSDILADGAHAVIYVSHHVAEVPATIDHILQLRTGHVVRCGPR